MLYNSLQMHSPEFPDLSGFADRGGGRGRFRSSSWQAHRCSSICMSGMHMRLPLTQMEHVCMCLLTACVSGDVQAQVLSWHTTLLLDSYDPLAQSHAESFISTMYLWNSSSSKTYTVIFWAKFQNSHTSICSIYFSNYLSFTWVLVTHCTE